jgi:hypothetical protein
MPDSALQPVADAIFARLNVPSLKAAQPTGAGCPVVTENPTGTVYPMLWYELITGTDLTGLGRGPDLTQIELRLHVFSTWNGMTEARRIMREAIRLLKYTQPTVAGYALVEIGRPHDEIALPFEELNGVKVRELVTIWDLFADEDGFAPPPPWVQGGFVQ